MSLSLSTTVLNKDLKINLEFNGCCIESNSTYDLTLKLETLTWSFQYLKDFVYRDIILWQIKKPYTVLMTLPW